ncbi:MAG: biopolymer transporter ExbD [Deltaproteobacteria bacterium]|nr:biopolymer transporter ExbD [Deltaproteobacteria bacterium]
MGAAVDTHPKGKGPRPDINITPLVDIVLVLLIIFMVITPQLEAGEPVEPPQVTNVDPSSKTKLDVLTLTYTRSGKYFVEKDALPDATAFEERLKQEHAKNAARRVMLKGDFRTEYGRMRDVFEVVQRVGFKGVSLIVSQKPGDPSDPAHVAGGE